MKLKLSIVICISIFFISACFPGEISGKEAGEIVKIMQAKGFHPLLATAIVSMLPVFELRGGIPVGILMLNQNPISVYLSAVIGNLIPVYPILLFLNPVMKLLQKVSFMSGFLFFLQKRAQKNKKLLEKYEELGLMIFVAIPLPVTGAWTGALIASLLGLKPAKSFLFITIGVICAGILVIFITLLGKIGIFASVAAIAVVCLIYVFIIVK